MATLKTLILSLASNIASYSVIGDHSKKVLQFLTLLPLKQSQVLCDRCFFTFMFNLFIVAIWSASTIFDNIMATLKRYNSIVRSSDKKKAQI